MEIDDKLLEPGTDIRFLTLKVDAGAEVTATPGQTAEALVKWAKLNNWPSDWMVRPLYVGYFELRDESNRRIPLTPRVILGGEMMGGNLLEVLRRAERECVPMAVLNDVRLQGR